MKAPGTPAKIQTGTIASAEHTIHLGLSEGEVR